LVLNRVFLRSGKPKKDALVISPLVRSLCEARLRT